MNEMSGRELESRLREHYRAMPVDTARDLSASVGRALDRAPRRRGTGSLLRRAAGLAAAAAVVLVAGAIFLSIGVGPSGAPSLSPAGASAAGGSSSASLPLGPSSGSPDLCSSPGPAASAAKSQATSSAESAAPCAGQTLITRDQAVAEVERFIGRKLGPVEFNPTVTDPTGQSLAIVETGPNGASAFVDMTTGRVTSLLLPAPETTNVALTTGQAETAATAYLTAHGIPFDGLTPAVTIEDHGCCKFYVVTWQRYVNGVTVPDSRTVGLDPSTGAVFEFIDTRKPYGPVASPQIGRDDAVRLATVASGFSNPLVGDVHQLVDGGPDFPGRLVWSIKLDDGAGASASHAWVYVDAITGEAKVVGRG